MIYLNFLSVLTVFTAAVSSVNGLPEGSRDAKRQPPITATPSELPFGYYSVFEPETPGSVNFTNSPGSAFSVSWGPYGSFLAGKGWNVGNGRNITYTGTYEPHGNSWIGVAGWTRVPKILFFKSFEAQIAYC